MTTKTLTSLFAGAILGVAPLFCATATAQAPVKDALIKKSGERIRGVEVLDVGLDVVKFRRGGSDSEMPAMQLLQIEWTEPPEAMELGRGAMERGDTSAAANFYQEAATRAAEAGRKALEQECRFLAARALAAGVGSDASKAGAARDALKVFVDGAGKAFRSPEARLLLARTTRLAGDAAASETLLKGIEEAALVEGWGLIWDARAKFEKAIALVEQGKGTEARIAYQAVASVVDASLGSASGPDAVELQSLKMLALVGQGETYLKEDKIAEAKAFFAKLATAGGGAGSRAAALAGEAHALLLQTAGKPDTKSLRDAQLKAAEAILLDHTSGDTTAKALYVQGRLLLALGSANESDNYKQRARSYFDSVVRYYGTSPWANEARLELAK